MWCGSQKKSPKQKSCSAAPPLSTILSVGVKGDRMRTGQRENSAERVPTWLKTKQARGIRTQKVQTRHYPQNLITAICRPHHPPVLVLVYILVRNIFRQPCHSRETLWWMGALHVYRTLWGDNPLHLHSGSPGESVNTWKVNCLRE